MSNPQNIYETTDLYNQILSILKEQGSQKPFIVCGRSFMRKPVYKKLMNTTEVTFTAFHDYEPNPKYESVVNGLNYFKENGCDFIISIGGGSPMDVAKSIKAFIGMSDEEPYILQKITPNDVPHLAIPTTAGTGSESTHFAVIYYEGKKYSVSDDSLLPEYVVLDGELLKGLPEYQRKATMMDALCHASESFWSVKSTEESRVISKKAIESIMNSKEGYLNDTTEGNLGMLKAANLAGQAINKTTTTAAHAMCYKITSLYGLAHGHSAALCFPKLWRYMLENDVEIQDPRGKEYVEDGFQKLSKLYGCQSPTEAVDFIENFINGLGLEAPSLNNDEELEILASSVNVQRLSNNPANLSVNDYDKSIKQFLNKKNAE